MTVELVLGLDRLSQVVSSHLERFGQRNELRVAWRPA